MSCPTCGHTIQCLYEKDGESAFWCPRCGTVKSPWLTSPSGERPKLVEHCRTMFENEDAIAKLEPPESMIEPFANAWMAMEDSIKLP